MPLNAGPEFEKAMEKYSSARTVQEKIAALKEALAVIPKHKGTENTRAFLQRRLAELKKELEKEKAKKGSGRSVLVQKEGFQVVLFGYPNSGKSYILKRITNARVEDTPFPLSTPEPVPGMMETKGGKVQIVEVPSYFDGYDHSRTGRIGLATMRGADAIALVIDLTQDPVEQVRTLASFLREERIFLNARPPNVKIERQYSGGINFMGVTLSSGERETLTRILHAHGIYNATVVFYSRVSVDEFELALDESARFTKAVLIGNKADLAPEEHVRAFLSIPNVEKVLFSADVEAFKDELLRKLGLIRVYTKPPRGEVSKEAIVLRKGARVEEVAEKVLAGKEMKFARLWRKGVFERRTVGPDFVLEDGDVVEIH